jgi:alkylhydroperoxidase family enzyme
MTRIAGLSPENAMPKIRAVLESSTRRFGRLLTPISVAAHHPDVFRGYMAYEGAIGRASSVDARLKSLASIKVAALVGCPF